MQKIGFLIGITLLGAEIAIAQGSETENNVLTDSLMSDDFVLDEVYEPVIPEVLHVTRMRQPRAEVPGSVTVITSDQIRQWGVRTVPELMRFVPGMFVKHGGNDTLAYHSSNPNIMRRLQVLVDGRSVYRAIAASVIWENLPVALEDIQRIEVVRGPNSASYGANAFMGTINIVTFDPMDTLGSRAYVRAGNQATKDAHFSHSNTLGDGAFRVTAEVKTDDGFDGRKVEGSNRVDQYRDAVTNRFLNAYLTQDLSDDTQLILEGNYMTGTSELPNNSSETGKPEQFTTTGSVYSRLTKHFSPTHEGKLQAYWQIEDRKRASNACVPVVSFDPGLYQLYAQNPYWAHTIGRLQLSNDQANAIALGLLPPSLVEAELEASTGREFDISQSDMDIAQAILLRSFNGEDLSQYYQLACGDTNEDFQEQRFDIEWQDTIHWSDRLHTISGLSVRQDRVNSETYYKGDVINNIYRLFATVKWFVTEDLIVTAGGMYEDEELNGDGFSPRLALNYMISPQQSVRLVYSSAVRSPDFLEQSPKYSYVFEGLDDNYLNLEDGLYYAHHDYDNRGLDQEEIRSIELGYFASVNQNKLTFDVKIYRDRLNNLISNPINLTTPFVNSDTEMDIEGIDWQVKWNVFSRHFLLWSGAYVDADVRLGDTKYLTEREKSFLQIVETRLSADHSNNLNWTYQAKSWSWSNSYFWHQAYSQDSPVERPYRRFESNWNKNWDMNSYKASLGVFWHHLVNDGSVIYIPDQYTEKDIFSVKLGVEF